VIVTTVVPLLASGVYVVEHNPPEVRVRVQGDWLKLPLFGKVVQVTLPVGLNGDTIAVQTTDKEPETELGEHVTEVEVTVLRTKSAVISPFPFIVAVTEGKVRSEGRDTGPLASHPWKRKPCVESGFAVNDICAPEGTWRPVFCPDETVPEP
jgi:hypothetical protein